MNDKAAARLWTKEFAFLCLIGLLSSSCVQCVNNTTSLYVNALGGTASFSGLLSAFFMAASVISRLAFGRLGDEKGHHRIMVLGCLIFGVAVAAYNLCPVLIAFPLWRFMQGVGFAAIGTAASASVVATAPPSRIGEGLSNYGLGQSFATAIGPYIGLTLIAGDDFSRVYWLGAGLLAVSVALSCFSQPPGNLWRGAPTPRASGEEAAPRTSEGESPPLRPPAARGLKTLDFMRRLIGKYYEKQSFPPALVQFLNFTGYSSVLVFLALFAAGREYADARYYFLFAAATMIAARLLLSAVVDKVDYLYLLVPSMLIGIAGFLTVAFTHSRALFLLAGVSYGIAHGVATPTLNLLAVSRAPDTRRGAATATFYVSNDIGMGVGAAVWGAVIDLFGFQVMYCAAAACIVLSLLLCIRFLAIKKKAAA